ncbi:MAG TPA: YdcF family protein [Holophagaceae bacterium]|nr:YdcF family protein [Holophagaceae bacterium]
MWSYSRMAEAVRLYRACRQEGHDCALFVSGGDADLTGRSEAEVYRDTLLGLGVDPRDLRLETHSLNTFQNAQFSSELLKREGADQVVLVSSGIHLRRSLCYFTHFGIRAEASASDRMKEKRSWMPLAYNLNLADVACHEHLGIFRYRVYQALGWNPKSTSPGGL